MSSQDPYHVLLCTVALHEAVWVFILEDLREGEVFGVHIHGHHSLIIAPQFGQSHPVCLTGGNLKGNSTAHNRDIMYSPV